MVRLADTPLDPAAMLAAFRDTAHGAGAIVSFAGIARDRGHTGEPLRALVLESYRSVTLRSMEAIAAQAKARFAMDRIVIAHRHGRILPGETIVFVATAAAHRRAAFEAADYLMDRLKSEAVFWKREETASGSCWIEPTGADARDLARWSIAPAPEQG